MSRRFGLVSLIIGVVLFAVSYARAAGPIANYQPMLTPPSDVDTLKSQVADLQKRVAALEKRVAAVEGPVNEYRSSPCRPSTGVPYVNLQIPPPATETRLVICAAVLP